MEPTPIQSENQTVALAIIGVMEIKGVTHWPFDCSDRLGEIESWFGWTIDGKLLIASALPAWVQAIFWRHTGMKLLLGSGGFRTEQRVTFLVKQMRSFFGDVKRILFVPYALADHDGYVKMLIDRGLHAGYELDGIHNHADPIEAVHHAEAIYVGGGNTFRLVTELHGRDMLGIIRQRVRSDLPYMGVSAGSNVACPTLMTTNDMPIVMPPSFETLGLTTFQINPHYFNGQTHVELADGSFQAHFGETRDDRIREFHEMNDMPVVGLWEGGVLRYENNKWQLKGSAARVFLKGKEPQDMQADSELGELLAS